MKLPRQRAFPNPQLGNERKKDVNAAEQTFAALAASSPQDAFNHLLYAVQDHTEVHRVVLPYRAWDLVGIIGKEQAPAPVRALLRQSGIVERRFLP